MPSRKVLVVMDERNEELLLALRQVLTEAGYAVSAPGSVGVPRGNTVTLEPTDSILLGISAPTAPSGSPERRARPLRSVPQSRGASTRSGRSGRPPGR